jgi:hypothetical protein
MGDGLARHDGRSSGLEGCSKGVLGVAPGSLRLLGAPTTFYLQTKGRAERVGFEPTRRLDTAYAISNLERAPYQFRARRPNLSHCVRLVWPLAAFVEVLTYPGIHCVRSRTSPVAVRLQQNYSSSLGYLTCSLRVIIHALHGFARIHKSRISKRLSLLQVAACCPRIALLVVSEGCQESIDRVSPVPLQTRSTTRIS